MKLIQYHEGALGTCLPCVNQVRSAVPAGNEYQFYDGGFEDVTPNCADYRAKSNIVRCKLAMETPDMLWLDTDTILLRWPRITFSPAKVYFARGTDGWPVNWAFYVNGCTDFFQRMYQYYLTTKPENIVWFTYFIKEHLSEIDYFPDGYFDHIMLSKAIFAGNKFSTLHAQNFAVARNKATGELKVEVYK
jgi:hypothetical protein